MVDADASIDRGARKRSKTIAKIIAFAICLPTKIDASRFSGPEHFFAGAPYIFLRKEIERRFFDADSTDADASLDRVARCLAPLHLHASRQTLCDTVRALESLPLSANLCTAPRIAASSSRSSTLSTPSHSYPRLIACSRLSPLPASSLFPSLLSASFSFSSRLLAQGQV